jgi:hypothetical protein
VVVPPGEIDDVPPDLAPVLVLDLPEHVLELVTVAAGHLQLHGEVLERPRGDALLHPAGDVFLEHVVVEAVAAAPAVRLQGMARELPRLARHWPAMLPRPFARAFLHGLSQDVRAHECQADDEDDPAVGQGADDRE